MLKYNIKIYILFRSTIFILFILVRHTSQYYRIIWLHRLVWLQSIFVYMCAFISLFTNRNM
jgi:hypothetical protein